MNIDKRLIELEELENELELICEEIDHASFQVNSSDFDFYNKTNHIAKKLHILANDLEETNDEICDILDWFFNATGEYPDTKHYGK